jgi:hypothetical protein
MFNYAVLMFAIAALVGASLAYMRIVKKDVSMPLALVHGLFAATGLVLLILGFVRIGGSGIGAALAVFLAAALGGFALFSFHLRSRPLPVPLVLIHGAAAVIAFLLLLLSVF